MNYYAKSEISNPYNPLGSRGTVKKDISPLEISQPSSAEKINRLAPKSISAKSRSGSKSPSSKSPALVSSLSSASTSPITLNPVDMKPKAQKSSTSTTYQPYDPYDLATSPPVLFNIQILYDYKGQADEEMSIKKGDVLGCIVVHDDGWWECLRTGPDARKGLIPSNFCVRI